MCFSAAGLLLLFQDAGLLLSRLQPSQRQAVGLQRADVELLRGMFDVEADHRPVGGVVDDDAFGQFGR